MFCGGEGGKRFSGQREGGIGCGKGGECLMNGREGVGEREESHFCAEARGDNSREQSRDETGTDARRAGNRAGRTGERVGDGLSAGGEVSRGLNEPKCLGLQGPVTLLIFSHAPFGDSAWGARRLNCARTLYAAAAWGPAWRVTGQC